MTNTFELIDTALRGPAQARAAHRQNLKRTPSIAAGVRQLMAAQPSARTADDGSPIFLLSAGWRSGSTMLQRLVMSDPRVMIWGEPYDECGTIQALASGVAAFRDHWPPHEYFYDGSAPKDLTGEWIANLFPPLEELRHAHRAFFDTLFAEPARRAGFERWGIKEVRLSADHAYYLRWLYPNARFVFLYRNPLDAYRSYCRYGRSWYDTFPDRPVFTPTAFGKHWLRLIQGFLGEAEALDARLLRYEDLAAGKAKLDDLEAYLGIAINREILEHKIGSSERDGRRSAVNKLEQWMLRRAVTPGAQRMGYRW